MAAAARLRLSSFRATSAGTRAVVAHPIHHNAAEVLEQLGGDVSGFAARQLTPKIAVGADLILTMTRAHRDAVLELAPRQLKRTFTLGEAAWIARDYSPRDIASLAGLRSSIAQATTPEIADPIGQSSEVFVEVGGQIAELLPPIMEICRYV